MDEKQYFNKLLNFIKNNDKSEFKEFFDNIPQNDIETMRNELNSLLAEDPITHDKSNDSKSQSKEETLTAYTNDLDYLWQEYQRLQIHTKIIETKKGNSFFSELDDENEILKWEHSLEKLEKICHARLKLSRNSDKLPRLERLVNNLNLSNFERNTLLILTTRKLFIDKSNNYDFDNADVKSLCLYNQESSLEAISKKKYFTKNAKLVKFGLLRIENHSPLFSNFYSRDVSIDNRLIEFFAGENYAISDYIDGSYLYKSNIPMERVILPEAQKENVTRLINIFPKFINTISNMNFSDVVEYGKALVFLFVGPSGTGKTLFANALSSYTDKNILLFNLSSHNQISGYSNSFDEIFSYLFREARMNNAILFFDESEGLLEDRIQDILIEVEKHEGIVIFATNASLMIEEAMRRRINHVVEFHDPSPDERKKIWEIHIPENFSISDDIDLESLSNRFEINGGLIKDAVFSAVAKAVYDAGDDKIILKMQHLIDGAKEQVHNKRYIEICKTNKNFTRTTLE